MELAQAIINAVLWACILILISRFVLDWVQLLARSWQPSGVSLVFCELIYSATDPPLRVVRKAIPPVRMGAVMLDLSPLVLLLVLYLLQIINSVAWG